MNALLDAFNKASGLTAHHVAITYPDLSLEFDGYQDGQPFHVASGPTKGNVEATARILGLLQKHKVMAALEHEINFSGNTMADETVASIRDSIARAKAAKAAAVTGISQAVAALNTASSQVTDAAKELNAEAVELQAQVAALTNGPA